MECVRKNALMPRQHPLRVIRKNGSRERECRVRTTEYAAVKRNERTERWQVRRSTGGLIPVSGSTPSCAEAPKDAAQLAGQRGGRRGSDQRSGHRRHWPHFRGHSAGGDPQRPAEDNAGERGQARPSGCWSPGTWWPRPWRRDWWARPYVRGGNEPGGLRLLRPHPVGLPAHRPRQAHPAHGGGPVPPVPGGSATPPPGRATWCSSTIRVTRAATCTT